MHVHTKREPSAAVCGLICTVSSAVANIAWGWPPCPHPGGQMLSGGPNVAGTAKFSRPKCTAALYMLGLHRPKPGCARLWLSLRFRSYISLSGTRACCKITKCGPQRAAERVLVSEFLRPAPPAHAQCCTSRRCPIMACGACGRGAARCKLGARVRQITEMTLQGWQELAFCSELLWPPPPPHVQCWHTAQVLRVMHGGAVVGGRLRAEGRGRWRRRRARCCAGASEASAALARQLAASACCRRSSVASLYLPTRCQGPQSRDNAVSRRSTCAQSAAAAPQTPCRCKKLALIPRVQIARAPVTAQPAPTLATQVATPGRAHSVRRTGPSQKKACRSPPATVRPLINLETLAMVNREM